MNIIEPYAKMLPPAGFFLDSDEFTYDDGINLLQHVEWCARISHRSEEGVTNDSWKRLLKAVIIDHGDWSVAEHSSVSVDAYVDRGITHEWVRHRLFAFTQESTRFVNYQKKMEPSFICPLEYKEETFEALEDWKFSIRACEKAYQQLIALGHAPQIARSVFPNALASRLIVTGNLRNWRHFFLMRTSKESHPQMRQVTIPLLKEFQEKIPLLYDDIEPGARQVDNLKKGR